MQEIQPYYPLQMKKGTTPSRKGEGVQEASPTIFTPGKDDELDSRPLSPASYGRNQLTKDDLLFLIALELLGLMQDSA